ncbi:small RNA NsiR4-regulated ssr1528 family protein [Sodalinema gerasimenkoae]|uniref:small RNA NsiR4-regulated ssr1528 family protein n=1 Tax=Sodalinema gerasimenkoae TaxID=2862348 RepID=UPI0013574982|nr:DUF4090 family protein [Sodalinema gerasimenkoae]
MSRDWNPATPYRGAEAIEGAIARGVDLDGSPIPNSQLELYRTVMELEAGRPRSGVTKTLRDRIVRIGCKHFPPEELSRLLQEANLSPLTPQEADFFYPDTTNAP